MRPRIRLDVLVTVFVGLVGILYFAGHGLAASPTLIRYQARLVDAAGVPLTGVHDLEFAIYPLENGGAELWMEALPPVDLGAGTVDLLLGEVVAITSAALDAPEAWLQVTVDGSILDPRQRLVSVPYSLVTDRLGTMTLTQLRADADAKIGVHAAIPSAHHAKTTDASELSSGLLDAARIDDDSITAAKILDGAGSGLDADTVDGLDSSEIADLSPWSLLYTNDVTQPFSSGTKDTVILPAGTFSARDFLRVAIICFPSMGCSSLEVRIRPEADCGGVPCFGTHASNSCANARLSEVSIFPGFPVGVATETTRISTSTVCDAVDVRSNTSIFNYPADWITTDLRVSVSTPEEVLSGSALFLRWWVYRIKG